LPEILIGLASCHEAFVAAPLIQRLLAHPAGARVALLGGEPELAHARALGLPEVEVELAREVRGERLDEVAAFARDVLRDAELVLTVGSGRLATALWDAARSAGSRCVHVDAGERTGDHRDRIRRLADHAADACLVRSDAEREHLLREGMAEADLAVVGSLTGQALAALPPAAAPAQPFVWLAGEHLRDPELEQTAREACERLDLQLQVAQKDDDPRSQLDRARTAAVIVTDSCGYQEFAAAAGIPCVVLAPAGARWDLLVSGGAVVAEHPVELQAAIEHARQSRLAAPPATDAAAAIVAALDAWAGPDVDADADETLPTEANASGRTFDDAELRMLHAALRSGTLNSTRGTFVSRFEREFAEWLGVEHAIACANGSAAVHCAIAALQLSAGDEVVTTPITDMGALTPIWYEGAVPVFADVDPDTLNVTADTIAAQLTERTRAIVVTHLFGRPCDMAPIVALAESRGLPLIEDTAQAFGATLGERAVGTFGKVSAFSLQQGKHITTGEGGIVCTDDAEIARRVFLFVNKAWGYGDPKPDHYFPALNYRMTELQGAVACAQLPKLDEVIAHRRMIAADLHSRLHGLAGIRCPDDPDNGQHVYWKWSFLVDAEVVPGGAVALGARMREQGIACAPRYVQKPAFECQLFRDWRSHPVSSLPLQHNPRGTTDGPLFDRSQYPGSIRGLEQVVVLPINERYRPHHVEKVADAIRRCHQELTRG
jgi:dTDP-4-amino-4,6-dideoxygalactose transaminase